MNLASCTRLKDRGDDGTGFKQWPGSPAGIQQAVQGTGCGPLRPAWRQRLRCCLVPWPAPEHAASLASRDAQDQAFTLAASLGCFDPVNSCSGVIVERKHL